MTTLPALAPHHLQSTGPGGLDLRYGVKVILVVDGSASMSRVRDQTEQAIRDFVLDLRNDRDLKFLLTYNWFDDAMDTKMFQRPLEKVDVVEYGIGGGTHLWDAIDKTLRRELERSMPVLCLIITDGDDMGSTIDEEAVRAEIAKRIGWGNWTFAWLGMGGASKAATRVGINDFWDFAHSDIKAKIKLLTGAVRVAAQKMRLTGTKTIKLLEAAK